MYLYKESIKFAIENNATTLSLNGCQLSDLPESLRGLKKLTTLDLNLNQLSSLPEWIGSFKHLTELYLNGNQLTELPESIGGLQQLNTLDLSLNKLTELPKSLGELNQLTKLELHSNQLTKLPEQLGELRQLKTLNLGDNQLSELPGSLGDLIQLTMLVFSFNDIGELPEWIGKLKTLNRLGFSRNGITKLPESLGNLTELTRLDCRSNEISELPEQFRSLTKLSRIDLSGNKFSKLPEIFSYLTQLSKIDLSRNELRKLPDSLRNLSQLTVLDLSQNKLSELPEWISELKQLTEIRLINNQFVELPESLCEMSQLDKFLINNNPLKNPPLDIARRGIKAISEYLNQRKEHGTEKRYECSVLLLGAPEVGKTTFRKKIENPDYISKVKEHRTVGVDILHWDFNTNLNSDGNNTVHVHWFDFGGQKIQHMCHHFFLNHNAFNLLIFKDSPCEEELSYWIALLKNINPQSTLLPICNQFDGRTYSPEALKGIEHKPQITLNLLNSNQLIFQGCLETIKLYISDFVKLKRVDWLKPWGSILSTLGKLDKPYISRSEFLTICASNGLKRTEEQKLLLGHLNTTGQAFYFPRIEGETVFIDPNWLIKALYTLFKPGSDLVNNGYFDFKDLQSHWSKPDHDIQRPAYSEDEQCKLRRLLLNGGFSICYETEKNSDIYFVPLQLEREPKLLPWEKITDNPLKQEIYLYKFHWIPNGFLSQLIVKLNQDLAIENQERCHWETGLLLRRNSSWCLIQKNDNRQHKYGVHILVHFKGELQDIGKLKDKVFSSLDESFLDFHFHSEHEREIPCLFCYKNESSNRTFRLDDDTLKCKDCGETRIDLHNLKMENIMVKNYTNTNSPGAVVGDKNDVTTTFNNVSIGDTQEERGAQVEKLDELIALIESASDFDNKKSLLRQVNYAKEELFEPQPDANDYNKYLNKAAKFLEVVDKTTNLFKKGVKLLAALGVGIAI